MSQNQLINYTVTIVPKGETLESSDETREETVTAEYNERFGTTRGLYELLQRENAIDKYALRNYWDIAKLDCEYVNPPWDSWSDFESFISQLDNSIYVETHTFDGQFTVITSVSEGNENSVESDITTYFDILNPIIKTGQITVCPEAPLRNLEEKFNSQN